MQISELVERAFINQPEAENYTLEDVFAADSAAREAVFKAVI